MKAIALLLALALAGHAAASIFRHDIPAASLHDDLDDLSQHHQSGQQTVHHKVHRKHHHHQSSSASSESNEKTHSQATDGYMTFNVDNIWDKPLTSFIVNRDDSRPLHGDMLTWKGVQIATGPRSPVTALKEIERIFDDAYTTMKHFTEEEKKSFHKAYLAANKIENEDVHLNSSQLLKKHQYKVEEHTVLTDDGYHLTVFRVAPKQMQNVQDSTSAPVVFLAHGLLGSSDDWLLMGPERSLAFILADLGYEVWLGNTRGSKYGRYHASKHEAQPDFWQFSNDEIALHDMPAMIDHALKTSQQKTLQYIGVSLGTTAIFALMASRPEYNEKISKVHAISPMVYMTKVRSPLFRMITTTSPFHERLQEQLGSGEFKPAKELIYTVGGNMCQNEIGCKNVCSNINFVMAGFGDLPVDRIPVVLSHLPAGGSTRQVQHYAQGVASHDFRKFDHGPEVNKKVYGHVQPPKYEMTEVRAPVVLYSAASDWLAHPDDVMRLFKELPNAKAHSVVADEQFSHMDFLFSDKAPQAVYESLIYNMKEDNQ
ncbi:lipase 3 [Papilio machaon]|uniref:lipase 3 n=1 Tax=Papilio machaon TaxID=76193 RepID=UPI001E663F48|nr:lipase 3 [Papilio machaon]